MDKRKLYESIMSNVAKEVKKALNESNMPDVDQRWMEMEADGVATDAEMRLVTDINGYSIDTLNDIVYARTGYHTWEQYQGIEDEYVDDDDIIL